MGVAAEVGQRHDLAVDRRHTRLEGPEHRQLPCHGVRIVGRHRPIPCRAVQCCAETGHTVGAEARHHMVEEARRQRTGSGFMQNRPPHRHPAGREFQAERRATTDADDDGIDAVWRKRIHLGVEVAGSWAFRYHHRKAACRQRFCGRTPHHRISRDAANQNGP